MPIIDETVPVNVTNIDEIDWGRNSLAIGVELKNRRLEDWSALDHEDLRILHALLTRRIMLKDSEGYPVSLGPVWETSKGLRNLADAVASMIRWYERGNKPA
jgi:hypothetical protein